VKLAHHMYDLLRWGMLLTFLHRLSSNHIPPNLHLRSSWGYKALMIHFLINYSF
jgi:hypothetical protein